MTDGDRLAQFLTTFFRDYLVRERNLSPHTVNSYRDAIKIFLRFLRDRTGKSCTELCMGDIDARLVRQFLAFLEEGRANSTRSRNHRLAVLRTFFDYVAGIEPRHAGVCQSVTAIPLKKTTQPAMEYLEKEEVEALLDAVDRGTSQGSRDYALLLFLYNSGARVEEAASLRTSCLTLTRPYRVSLFGKGRKWRVCPLWQATGEALRNHLGPRGTLSDEPVFLNRFGGPLSRHGILDVVEKYVKMAAVTMPRLARKRISPHTLRHTTAMHLMQSGVDLNAIRAWLGHASLQTTHQYAQIDLKMKTQAMERCEVSFLKPGETPVSSWKANPDILAWLESL